MSRYPPPSDYRGFRERSRSPPRFSADRRGSTTSLFPPRAADAPRGPRQFDGPLLRQSMSGPGPAQRPGFQSLRDAPPLGSIGGADRERPFRGRDFDRPPRVPSPRDRSPPRAFKDPRDYPPRELDIPRARRASRDGPPSAGSTYSDNPPFASGPPRGGGFGRGRGRGDFEYRGGRGGRGGRRDFEERDRDLLRRDKSPPPPRWSRDLSREGRDPERREDRRFIRREDERRPEWFDRERDLDRSRREQLAPRLETRRSDESVTSAPPPPSASQTLQIDPGRLAILEQAGVDLSVRRPSVPQNIPPPREVRRELPETPSYLNGRAETTANRYNQRGSSPPTQAPPVPAFSFFAPSAPAPSFVNSGSQATAVKQTEIPERAITPVQNNRQPPQENDDAYNAPADVTPELHGPSTAPKAELRDHVPEAPKAPRAFDADAQAGLGNRLHGVRSLENLERPPPAIAISDAAQPDSFARPPPSGPRGVSPAMSAASAPSYPMFPASMQNNQSSRMGELAAPTGPRASRTSPALASVSPRPPFASPRSDLGGFQGLPGFSRGQTPPPMAPSGPRNRSYSVSPKVASSTVPTAPRMARAPPLAPRAAERAPAGVGRGADRFSSQQSAQPPWAPPTAPKSLQWNQWRRPGQAPPYGDKLIPAKRDFGGEEKQGGSMLHAVHDFARRTEPDQAFGEGSVAPLLERAQGDGLQVHDRPVSDKMDIDSEPVQRSQQPSTHEHSARQSFFGKPEEPEEPEDEDVSMSETAEGTRSSDGEDDDDEQDPQQDMALFRAKFDRQKRELEAKMFDLGSSQFRATEHLESIARLSRLSEKDLRRSQEKRDRDMEVDPSPPAASNHLAPPVTHSSSTDEGPDLLTPKGEAEAAVEVRSSGESSENARQMRRPSPEIISLPYLVKEPREFQNAGALQETIDHQEECKAAVIAALHEEADDEFASEEDEAANFDAAYLEWRRQCEDLDRAREEQERLELQKSADPGPEMLPPVAAPINPTTEGRRLHKYSSEYALEQVLKQSEETARLEQEKHERESEKMQATIGKEAKVPDQQGEKIFRRSVFVDTNRLREPDMLTRVFSYEPQPDTFTENEQQIFIAAFKETPKKWGEISSLLPGRTYKDCIHHYYANKWDGRFRDNKYKKFKGGRRGGRGRGGRRGGGAMADMAGAEELLAPQITSESGRPKRAAAPTTFGEREQESKAALVNPSPAKKQGPTTKLDANGDAVTEKPGKRRRGAGEKPGRKAKATQQPLAALAAAPVTASPNNRPFLPSMHPKEEFSRGPSLEEASLLTALHSNQTHFPMAATESQSLYQAEDFAPTAMPLDDAARRQVVGQTSGSRSGASSYWSVPEQQDFVKYIAHFGTDFSAIANHMGTKTQTMIKNHYQRQVVNGNQPELENAAKEADRRRDLGDDMGPPPTPTPIIKRKYDAPQPTAPRTLAPHTDAMEFDEPVAPAPARQAQAKHMSPPQYQAQPRFTSAQSTPIPAQRVIPSPVTTTASPALPKMQASAPPRPIPHPLGAGLAFTESRPESRAGLAASDLFRQSATSTPRGQQPPPPQQQPPQGGVDPRYVQGLIEEQHRALRVQQEQDRIEQFPRQPSFHRGSAHGSPADRPLRDPNNERKSLFDERSATPPRTSFIQPPFSRPLIGSSGIGPFRSTPFSLMGPAPIHPSPPKKEVRPTSVPTAPQGRPFHVPPPAPPPDPPKRSNLLSILNDEPDEPKPPKRESLPGFPQRALSPAQANMSNAPTPAPGSSMHPLRRETFGQVSVPQSQFNMHRPSFAQHGSASGAIPSGIKQEQSGAPPSAQPPKPDWAARVLGQPPGFNQPSQPSPPPTLEREVRPYFSHRAAALGGLNQTRMIPSPPPHSSMGHSRTPSLTMQTNQQGRDQRPPVTSQAQQPGIGAALHPNPYGQTPNGPPPFLGPPPPEARNHAHHSHNSSLTGNVPPFHHRGLSREDSMRQDHAEAAARRDRDNLERMREVQEHEQRQREHFYAQQREQQHQQQRQQQHMQQQDEDREREMRQRMFSRGPPPPQPLQPPAFSAQAFAQDRFGANSIREQAQRETEVAMRQQQQQQQQDVEQRMRGDQRMREEAMHREAIAQEQLRFRQQGEAMFRRQTPLGGNYGHPPPQPPRR